MALNTQFSFSQGIDMVQTVNYFNEKLGQDVRLDVVKGSIVAKYFEDGEMFREDKVLCKLLDHGEIGYDAVNRIFYVNCEGNALCVDRKLYQRKIRREYVRLSFPVSLNASEAAGMENALRHMIRLVTERKYQSNEPFEK